MSAELSPGRMGALAQACGDPGSLTPRDAGESIPRWSARAASALIEAWLAEERERVTDEWVARLSILCDDEWLKRRDRAMELPGVKGHRWERRAASAWEQAANGVRSVLDDLANYTEEYVERHASYLRWMNGGRDKEARDVRP